MWVALLLVCWPVAEVLVAIKIAEAIGVLPMLLLLVASWPAGTWALRKQGGAAWRRLADTVAAGNPPARDALDGVLVLIGGALMIIPGFITDLLGVFLLLAPTRSLVRGPLVRILASRLILQATRFRRRPAQYDVDSSATDLDRPGLER
jgi:UPF0716 protein FxsA